MMSLTDLIRQRLEVIQSRLRRYREAENAILSSQSYSVEGLQLTRADLGYVQKMIAQLEREELQLMKKFAPGGRSRMRYVIPREEFKVW